MEPSSLAGGRRGYQQKHSQSNNDDDDDNISLYMTRRHNTNCTSSSLPFPHFPPPPQYPPPPTTLSNDIEYKEQPMKKRNGRNSSNSCNSGGGGGSGISCNDSAGVGGGKMHRYPDDLDSIELCIEAEQLQSLSVTKSYKGGNNMVLGGSSMTEEGVAEPQLQKNWSRNNIAATMERFEPTTTPKHNNSANIHQQQQHNSYSYTYFEPKVELKNFQNIPITSSDNARDSFDDGSFISAGAGSSLHHEPSSSPPPPNSMRALLAATNRHSGLIVPSSASTSTKSIPGSMRHMYTTRYGTQENIYEEIGSEHYRTRMLLTGGQSMISLNQSMVEEEFRRVQTGHRRVLGELNLSVEAMLMPSTPPSDSPTEEEDDEATRARSEANILLADLLASVEPTDELLSPVSANAVGVGDMDSGFSGSSSGASCVGSIRYRAGSAMSTIPTRSSTPNGIGSSTVIGGSSLYGSCSNRSSQRSNEDPGVLSLTSRYSGLCDKNSVIGCRGNKSGKVKSAEDPGPVSESKPKISFWIRKGWRKFPGFSSTTSMHKAGITNDEHKLNSGAWEDPLPLSNTSKITGHQLNTIGSRRSEPFHQQNYPNAFKTLNIQTKTGNLNNNHLTPLHHGVQTTNNHHTTHNNCSNSNRRRLEQTPSAISSEDSWYSERAGSENDLSSEGEDESDRSISSTNARNSQLRSTLNKAKHHLSFDKWRNGGSTNSSHSSSASGGGGGTGSLQPHHDSTSPGESPGGRLSRWFSIRRGSVHHYDLGGGGGSGKESRGSSVETDDNKPPPAPSSQTLKSSGGNKMPQLSETEEDSNAFGLIGGPNGSRTTNGSILTLRGVCSNSRPIPPSLPPAPAGLSQQQLKRRHIVAAIVHSENSYVATLQRLVNDYRKPLEDSNPPILSSSKISTLFHRLPEILQCHTLFRIALADCVRNWDRDEQLGDVFVGSFGKPIVLDIYSGFINNFSAAMELAKMEAKRKSALADFFKVKQISAHDRLSFFGLMVKPVQRFPQFILFLQDLLKYTPQGHHDRMNLQLALTQLESLAEMLNERKREAEQYQAFKEMLGHISGTFNTRALSSDGNRNRYLLREDNVTQLEFNQSGFIVKSKQRRLLLLNDKVICVSVAPKQSADFGATEKLSFKWMHPVNDVEIVDNSTSATLSRILTAGLNRGASLKSNSSNSGTNETIPIISNGADNLCSEMSTLMHDYEVMSRINDLVGTLKGTYNGMNVDVTKSVLATIQSSIQKKDEEMAWVDSCCLQLITKNKNGKEETFTFQTENPSVKKEWVTELRLAQLALDTNNSPAWEVPEHEQRPSTKMPLFVKAQPVYKSHHQTEVRCGCFYTTTNHNRTSTRRRSRNQNYLWICTSDGISSHIAVLSQHHQRLGELKDVGSFDLAETLVTSMEFVKGVTSASADILTDTTIPSLDGDTVWMGTDSRKLLIYTATNPEQEKQIGSCTVPAPVTQVLHHLDNVFVSLINGTVHVFKRHSVDGHWLLKESQIIGLGSSSGDPVSNLLPINSNVYAGCGRRVWVINGHTSEILKPFDVQHIQHGSNLSVNLMAHSGIGLWVSLKNSSIICLYHTETFKHLQDINIASNVLRVTSSQRSNSNNSTSSSSSVFVTALMACKGLLWVGTNVGISLTIPLPRLEGVPIISGGVNISYHAHFGPITFLLPLVPKNYSKTQQIAPISTSELLPSIIHQQSSIPLVDHQTNDASKDPEIIINTDEKKGNEHEDNSDGITTEQPTSTSQSQTQPQSSTPRKKLEKQNSLDITAKLRAQLTNSPVVIRRRRFKDANEMSRMSKTLPRGLGSAGGFSSSVHSNASSSQSSEQGVCDVYGLYGGLIFVKEDFETEQGNGNLMDPSYESLRRSDPELAAIPAKVSTLDRRLRMKVSRPRSLDLSNWSVDSRSSSLYTSSGSEESMGIRLGLYASRSVSRNSSNASHKTQGNGSDLMNISENGTCMDMSDATTASVSSENHSPKSTTVTPPTMSTTSSSISSGIISTTTTTTPSCAVDTTPHVQTVLSSTMKKRKTPGGKQQMTLADATRGRTVITLMGGRGYVNWRHVWYNTEKGKSGGTVSIGQQRAPNSNDAHIAIWEKML